jgi:hypothetical protein
MTTLWVLFLGLGALSAFLMAAALLRKRTEFGVLLASASVVVAWEFPDLPAFAAIAGANLFPYDVVAGLFILVGVTQWKTLRANLGVLSQGWAGLGILILVALIRGVVINDLGTAVNEFRPFFYSFAALTWGLSVQWTPEQQHRMLTAVSRVLGLCLVVAGVIHISTNGLGGSSDFVFRADGTEQVSRPLVAGQTLVLLICTFAQVWDWFATRRRTSLFCAILFVLMILLSQQRTVWLGAVISLFIVLMLSKQRTKIAMLLLLGISLIGYVFVSAFGRELAIFQTLSESATNSQTYDARVRSWLALIDQSVVKGLGTIVFGSPFGAGWGRFEGVGRWVEFSPHNWYLTVYLRTGLVGLVLLLVFVILPLLKAVRRSPNLMAVAILVVIAVFSWTYGWLWYVAPFQAWATVELMRSARAVEIRLPNKHLMSKSPPPRMYTNEMEST